jgi:hypothetical protein
MRCRGGGDGQRPPVAQSLREDELRRSEQDVADRRGVPLGSALCGGDSRIVEVLSDLPQGITP